MNMRVIKIFARLPNEDFWHPGSLLFQQRKKVQIHIMKRQMIWLNDFSQNFVANFGSNLSFNADPWHHSSQTVIHPFHKPIYLIINNFSKGP